MAPLRWSALERLALRWNITGAERSTARKGHCSPATASPAPAERHLDPRRAARAPDRVVPGPGGAVKIIDRRCRPGRAGRAAAALDRLRGPREDRAADRADLRLRRSDLPDGQGWASETVKLITHAGTHVDAPWHYFPTSGGERARTIDECRSTGSCGRRAARRARGAARRADRGGAPGGGARRLRAPALRHRALWTGAEEAWDTPEYFNSGSGLRASRRRGCSSAASR